MFPTTMGTNGTNGYNEYKWFPIKGISSSGSQIVIASKDGCLDRVIMKLEIEYTNEKRLSITKMVLTLFETTKMNLQCNCNNPLSHPAIESDINGVTKTSQTHTINAFSETLKLIFLAENAMRTLTESETRDICKAIARFFHYYSSSSPYNSSNFLSQRSSSSCNLSSTSCKLSVNGSTVSIGQRSHSKIIFSDRSTQTEEKCAVESERTQILSQILEEKKSEIVLLGLKLERSEGSLAVTESEYRKEVQKLFKENKLLKNKIVSLENKIVSLENGSAKENMKVTSLQLEHLSVEYDKLAKRKRTSETLNKPLSSNHITSLNPLLESSSLISSQQTRKESRTHHSTGSVSFPRKSSSRELQSFDNEFLSPARQRMQNLPGDTHCEKNGTVSCDNVWSNKSGKDHTRWKNISSLTENSSSEDQPNHGHEPPCDEPPLPTVSRGGQDDQQFNCSQNKMERSNGSTSITNNNPNNSSKLQDSSQEAKQKSNVNSVNSTGNSRAQDSNIVHEDDEAWLCHHYKRRCFVNFSCCDTTFWPCHRCHNNKSKCGVKRLKSCHTKEIKCASCGEKQEFGKNSQHCTKCDKKFAEFFCVTCKHLTGMDDNPYHCDKCGICRIRSNRSFHCDVCGVCLDVQLKDKHKCRSGSAHDECCICLEDAFSGCQILPCSHKVHKECATKMIRSGITCCPICRESFAHKLQRKS